MSANTRIFVLRMKNIIYTAIFIVLAIVLILLLIFMFSGNEKNSTDTETSAATVSYVPGIYSSSFNLNGQTIVMEVTVDSSRITSVSCINLSEAVTTMYPLVPSVLDSIQSQLLETQDINEITYTYETQYTASTLIDAIKDALSLAKVNQ